MNAMHDLARMRKASVALAGSDDTPALPQAQQPDAAAPKPLPDDLLPVEAFPLAALPETFRPWVADVSQRMNCPPDFVAVPLIVAAASLVARHVGIRPQARTDWIERGNLWALIVGRPGIMKSPAMAQALAPMDRLEARAAEGYRKALDDFTDAKPLRELRAEAGKKAARAALKKDAQADVSDLLKREAEDDEPIRKRYVVADATYEKLGEIFVSNPGGVLSVRDEMRGLFLHLAREESATARAFYLQAWSGGSYHFDRIGRGTVTVEDARLSMIGGIQPGPLSDLMLQARRGAADDGMIERFLIAWPDSPGEWRDVDRWPDNDAKRKAWEAFDRLDGITPEALQAEVQTGFDGETQGLPFLRFAGDAREAFAEWRTDLEAKLRGADLEAWKVRCRSSDITSQPWRWRCMWWTAAPGRCRWRRQRAHWRWPTTSSRMPGACMPVAGAWPCAARGRFWPRRGPATCPTRSRRATCTATSGRAWPTARRRPMHSTCWPRMAGWRNRPLPRVRMAADRRPSTA